MVSDPTVTAKYVFLDIVGFTRDRSVEAQCHVVDTLNRVVKRAVEESKLSREQVLFIPTGDGICIAILDALKPVDIHLSLALRILSILEDHNEATPEHHLQFQLRIGVNENVDNRVTDINGNHNVAGAGISYAARIMDSAEGNHIFVGATTYETLRHRESYLKSFRPIVKTIKHNLNLTMYQFIAPGHEGLNVDPPSYLQSPTPSKIPKVIAYYVAIAARNKAALRSKKDHLRFANAATMLIWFLAKDAVERDEAGELGTPYMRTHRHSTATFVEQLDHYLEAVEFVVGLELAEAIDRFYLTRHDDLFLHPPNSHTFISDKGIQIIKADWPAIAKEHEI